MTIDNANPHPPHLALAEELRPFDPIDLLQRCAALQLCPENAQLLFRLEYFSCVAATIAQRHGASRMSEGRLRRTLDGGMGISHLEDSFCGPFASSLTFTGGNYTVLPGLTEGLRPSVDLLLSAALLSPELDAAHRFRNAIAHPCQALLRLGDATCERAGLARRAGPGQSHRLFVPRGERLQRLRGVAQWSDLDLRRLFDATNLRAEHLAPFQLASGVPLPEDFQPGYGPLLTQPLVRGHAGLVVALPHALLTAVSQFVLSNAAKFGVLESLSQAFHRRAIAATDGALALMGNKRLGGELTVPSTRECATEAFHFLDTDKLLHVVVVTDDLRGYVETEPFGSANYPTGPELDSRFRAGLERASSLTPPPREILGLVVLCGIGRHAMLGLNGGDDRQQVLLSQLSEIVALSYLEPRSPLYLWSFSRARERLGANCEVVAWSLADEIYYYRKWDSSFYLSDQALPTHLSLHPNSGDELTLEAERRFDPHAIGSASRGYQQYVRVYPGSAIPVYCPQQPSPDEAIQCIELNEGAIWVTTPVQRNRGAAASMMVHLVDALAFWLARMAEHEFVRRAAAAQLTIKVIARDPQLWRHSTPAPQNPSGELGDAARVEDGSVLTIEFPPETMALVVGTAGDEERQLFLTTCRAIASCVGIAPADADAALIATLATPRHRKIIPFSLRDSVAARPRSLPPPGLVSAAAEQEVLDQIGGWLDTSGFAIGPIRADRRKEALNGTVAFLFDQFAGEIARLRPDSLLEWLVAHNEAIVDEHELLLHREPFELVSFGNHAEPARDFADRLFEIYKADSASRFIIEYVAARPPGGTKPISFSDYHRVLALAAKIIFFGMLSDDLHYETDAPELARLPSGRIGISGSRRAKARDQYAEVFGIGRRQRLIRSDAGAPEWVRVKQVKAITAIEEASAAEFGYSLSQHLEIIGAALQLCVRHEGAVTRVSRPEFLAAVQTATGVDAPTAARWLADLSLAPRADFRRVPAPAKEPDIYPWRYNRRWSYVRRPFLVDGDDIVFGTSHVERSGTYLRHLCFSGRLKATTDRMRRAIGYATNASGARFNCQVASVLRECAHLIVRERIGRVGIHRIKHTLGDVDVLVADPHTRRLRAYECKDLSVARTPSELHNELKQLAEGHGSFVAKHDRRVEWIRAHLDSVLEELGAPNHKGWDVAGAIVVDQEIVSPYLVNLPLMVMSIAQVEQMLARQGTVL